MYAPRSESSDEIVSRVVVSIGNGIDAQKVLTVVPEGVPCLRVNRTPRLTGGVANGGGRKEGDPYGEL